MASTLTETNKRILQDGEFARDELNPKGKWLTPFNIISIPVILLGIILIIIRFTQGLGSVTNLSQDNPWGLWISFDVNGGVCADIHGLYTPNRKV
jgi:hypothetical protein